MLWTVRRVPPGRPTNNLSTSLLRNARMPGHLLFKNNVEKSSFCY
jgi:hypothetical protein